MDADGRLSPGAAHTAIRMFADRRIGAVQLIVRIRDRHKLIAQLQDIEFWMISALSQFARSISGTVSLGGNGQFTRLTALQQLDGDLWSRSLTEDLDLGLRLIAAGWRITTTREAFVDQQAVDTFPRLLRQRTRWYQGHMESVRRLPALVRSDKVNEVAVLEVTSYLLVPWLIVLPWSVLQQWIIFQIVVGSGHGIFATGLGGVSWRLTYALLWYVLSFAPNILIGVIYARRTRAVTLRRALVLGHLMIAWNYIGYLAAWRAVGRMLRGRIGLDQDDPQHRGGRAVRRTGRERALMARVAVILGTRPEIIKLSGIIDGLGPDAVVLHTGQHYDAKMSQVFLDQVGCPPPDVRMDLGARTRAEQIGTGVTQLGAHLAAIEPDAVIVQGDTNSALAGALAANAGGFPLVHVEAGLRSYDRAMPEEHNRVLIDHLSDLLAAPTETAVSNLAREGISGRQVLCTGNTVVESVREQLPSAAARRALIAGFGLRPDEYILATIHRPENTDDPDVLAAIIDQLASLELPVVAPLHPRTVAAAERAGLTPQLAAVARPRAARTAAPSSRSRPTPRSSCRTRAACRRK